jgi:glutaredoxin
MKTNTKILVVTLGLLLLAGCKSTPAEEEVKGEVKSTGEKVKLDFHIMSKCPFGVKVLQGIMPVLDKMGDRIDFNVNYIGRAKGDEITSMHGEQEVQGDILQLCAKEVGNYSSWIAFLKCQTEEWRKIPEGWETCAKTAKIDQAKLKACYEGDQGKKLLKTSVEYSEKQKASGSPTIFLAGQPYSGGRTEASFGRAICEAFKGAKPAYCEGIPAPLKVPVTVVKDDRCQGRGCDSKRFLSFVSHMFEGAEIKELDYSDPEGKELFQKSGQQYLPIAIFGPEVEKDESGYSRLKRRFVKMEGTENWVYPLGRTWDPAAEICDDGKDNTGDGKVDCDDETCKGKKACREEIKNKLDVFVMSQCPYGVKTVDAMEEVLKNFGYNQKKINFEVNFIGNEQDGKLSSMHGQTEVDEDLRQLCVQKHYNKNYKFMDYILCRNKDYRSTDWETCATKGIKADVIKKCAESEEGKQLLIASFKKATDLGISGSPNWLLNNRFDMNARNSNSIKDAFCEKNSGLPGCEAKLSDGSNTPSVPAGSCGPGGAEPPKPQIKLDQKVGGEAVPQAGANPPTVAPPQARAKPPTAVAPSVKKKPGVEPKQVVE